jgi:PAS domain S-box-containing protein
VSDPATLIETWPTSGTGAVAGAAPAAHAGVLRQMARGFFAVAALAAGVAAALSWIAPSPASGGPLVTVIWGLLGVAALVGLRLPARATLPAMVALIALACLVVAGSAWFGAGPAAPGLGVLGVLVCVASAVAGRGAGASLAALGAALLLAVHLGRGSGLAALEPGAWLQFGVQALGLLIGLAAGMLVAHVVMRHLRAADERERRFASLLAIAADAYWEIDHAYRSSAGIGREQDRRAPWLGQSLGQVPWEQPHFGCDPEVLDRLLADLDARNAFRDVAVRWGAPGDEPLHYLLSGEPRFDERGRFTGYWGVARDVTAETEARAALAATETRYRELFSLIPTPLVLHRGGRPIDANPAALRLFGVADLDRLIGTDILARYESGDSRERARRRIEQLQGQPQGTALPVTDFRLRVGERRISVRATGVTVDAAGGPAILSIFIDDTERLAAEELLRRSESLLSHLVATSPDVITLTELASGRYAMVNQAFERVIGWSAGEAVGRTSLELGVWRSASERERFVRQLTAEGRVADLPIRFAAKSGAEVSLLVSAARFVMDRRDYIVINARDVTGSERSRLEREAILANASVGIAVTHAQRFVLANLHFEALFGWPHGELLGQGGRVVWTSDEEYAAIGALYGPALGRGERVDFERRVRRRDGSSFLAFMRAHAIDPEHPSEGGTVWIVEDITERRAAEQALARARDEAEAANRAKSAFLANTSHELRTPLNGIIGLAHLAREPGLDAALRTRYLDQIAESGQALAGIIADILDLSKIEAGKLQIEASAFDPALLVESLRSAWLPQAVAKGLALRVETGPGVAGAARGDVLRVRQIASNFLSNAIKFTAQGEVVLRLARPGGGERLRIEVQDDGPGIDQNTLARLFRPFTQADESTTRRYGGSGLGLSICRELATLMGGEVGVASEVGSGSLFWAELPLPAAAEALPLEPAPKDEPSLAGVRVLLVEDNPVNMVIAVAMLERWGVEVVQAADGCEAVAAARAARAEGWPFDLVLMDVQMPVMSGHEATRALRAEGHRLPIVALTAAALVTERDQALAAGMDDFLTKPIDVDRLRATLLRWRAPGVAGAGATGGVGGTIGTNGTNGSSGANGG